MAEAILKACLMDEIIRPRDLRKHTGLSRQTIWRLERKGDFVTKYRLSTNAVGYLRSDVEEWRAKRAEKGGNND